MGVFGATVKSDKRLEWTSANYELSYYWGWEDVDLHLEEWHVWSECYRLKFEASHCG